MRDKRPEDEKATELAQKVAAACTDMGAPVDEEAAVAVVRRFTTIAPSGHSFTVFAPGYDLSVKAQLQEQEQQKRAQQRGDFGVLDSREPEPRVRFFPGWSSKPQLESPGEYDLYVIHERPGGGEGVKGEGAVSKKPFNVLLDMRQLIEAITGGVIAVSGALVMPWLAVFAALYIWCTLSRAATVGLSEREASVLWTLWMRRDPANNTSPNAELLRAVNKERETYGHSPITQKELEAALHHLVHIRSIERYSQDRSRWWLREWVVVEYE